MRMVALAAFVVLVATVAARAMPRAGFIASGSGDGQAPVSAIQQPMLEQEVVDGCLACHRDELSLADKDRDELRERITAISSGQAEHLVPIPQLSDEDLTALVEALAPAK